MHNTTLLLLLEGSDFNLIDALMEQMQVCEYTNHEMWYALTCSFHVTMETLQIKNNKRMK
jgi:hypothetical protein